MSDASLALAGPTPAAPPPSVTAGHTWRAGGFGFKDLVDIVNPLQHLPVIGSVYRWATGDEESDGARMVGDTLYGGPVGLAIGAVGTMTEDAKGRDLGERALAGVFGGSGGKAAPAATALAAAPAAIPTLAKFPTAGGVPARAPGGSPMMSLFTSAPPVAGGTPALQNPQASFLTHTAMLQRQISTGQPPSERAAQLSNHVIPLELSGGQRFGVPPRPSAPAPAPTPPPAAAKGAAAAPVAAGDIAQKMMQALDKYEKLQLQQKPGASAPGTPQTGGTDLSL